MKVNVDTTLRDTAAADWLVRNRRDTALRAVSDGDLQDLADRYPGSEELVSLIKGIRESRAREAEALAAREQFEAAIAKLANGKLGKNFFRDERVLPIPPNGVHNVHFQWADDQWIATVNKAAEKGRGKQKCRVRKREVTVTKLVGGQPEWRWGFRDGETASSFVGLRKDKQSAVARLQNYRNNDGVRYLVDYGIAEGVLRQDIEE